MNFKKYKLKDLIDNFSVRARDYGGSDGLEFLGVSNDDGIVKSKSAEVLILVSNIPTAKKQFLLMIADDGIAGETRFLNFSQSL